MGLDALSRLIAESLYLALYVSAPAVLTALGVGLLVAVLSAATQVQEPTLGFVPKLVGVSLALAAAGAWMADTLVGFTAALWRAIPALVG